MLTKISAVMIVRDGDKTIERSLKSLAGFEEVIVYDTGSVDRTIEIANTFNNVRQISGIFEGFGPTKNKAAGYAKNDWVLIVDSDEVLEDSLAQAMHTQILNPKTVYLINFKAFYKDRQIRYCGWNDQKIRRLYHKQNTCFSANYVHENLIESGMKLEELKGGSILHYSYQTLSDFIVKIDRYSTLFAQNNQGLKNASPSKAFLNGIYSFFRTYVIKRGFLDGYVGLVIAFSHMATNFYKYIKLYEENKAADKVCSRDK